MNCLRSISAMSFVVMMAIAASCGVSNDPRDDPEDSEAAESGLAVPPELQLITPDVTCASTGNVCTSRALCTGSGGHTVNATCASGKVCCHVPSGCQGAGGVCTSAALCRGSGGHTVTQPCSGAQVCCVQP